MPASYKELYDHCQSLDHPVSRRKIRDKLFELTDRRIAITISSSLKAKDVRGMFLSIESENAWVRQHGCDVVVISRDIAYRPPVGNYCWDRFITVKEMMHLFDTDEECSDTGDKFDEIISSFFMTWDSSSPIVNSENKGFLRALGVLCSEKNRLNLAQDVRAGNMTHYDVALKLKIPEQYVPNFLSDKYLNAIEQLFV